MSTPPSGTGKENNVVFRIGDKTYKVPCTVKLTPATDGHQSSQNIAGTSGSITSRAKLRRVEQQLCSPEAVAPTGVVGSLISQQNVMPAKLSYMTTAASLFSATTVGGSSPGRAVRIFELPTNSATAVGVRPPGMVEEDGECKPSIEKVPVPDQNAVGGIGKRQSSTVNKPVFSFSATTVGKVPGRAIRLVKQPAPARSGTAVDVQPPDLIEEDSGRQWPEVSTAYTAPANPPASLPKETPEPTIEVVLPASPSNYLPAPQTLATVDESPVGNPLSPTLGRSPPESLPAPKKRVRHARGRRDDVAASVDE